MAVINGVLGVMYALDSIRMQNCANLNSLRANMLFVWVDDGRIYEYDKPVHEHNGYAISHLL